MSYTEHYTCVASYSGSKTISCPASDHSYTQTVHYSGTVPVSVNITVDSIPFDHSVAGTKTALGVVAAALGTAQAAQVATIHKESQRVAQTVTKNFFRIVGSEVSSRIAGFKSSMQSMVGLLSQEGASIEHVHEQMDGDYHAIKRRYLRIFDTLDKELERRILELDRPAFTISQRAMRDVVVSPFVQQAGQALVHSANAEVAPSKIACAHTKGLVASALDDLGTTCQQIQTYARQTGDLLGGEAQSALIMQPVVFSVEENLNDAGSRVVVHQAQHAESDQVRREVMRFVGTRPEQDWCAPSPQDQQAIDDEFARRVDAYASEADAQGSASAVDRGRVSALMMELYRGAHTQTTYDAS